MTRLACGCAAGGCHCCDGTVALTPLAIRNRPGLDALRDRVGTHGAFLETMKARLGTVRVDAPGADGQTIETFQPLRGLTTRDPSDPAIALLDGWAMLADVLTFYQERISNEGYLRTATERGSLVSLGRTVGYAPRPGAAASTFLWYEIDPGQDAPVVIPAGTRAQSVPQPGEFPQSYETSADIEARAEWNALAVRQTTPQRITLAAALAMDRVHLAGGTLGLRTGDTLLFVFDQAGDRAVTRSVAGTEVAFGENRTTALLVPLLPLVAPATLLLLAFIDAARAAMAALPLQLSSEFNGAAARMVGFGETLAHEVMLGMPSNPLSWPDQLDGAADGDTSDVLGTLFPDFTAAIAQLAKPAPPAPPVAGGPDSFVGALLKPPAAQAASAERLGRDLAASFAANRDATPQLLLDLVPQIRDRFYAAWANAAVHTDAAPLQALHVFRAAAAPFGAGAAMVPQYDPKTRMLLPAEQWTDWTICDDDGQRQLWLDQQNDAILPGSYVLVLRPTQRVADRVLLRVLAADAGARSAYGQSGKTTRLTLAGDWLAESERSMDVLRGTLARVQSEPLALAEAPIEAPIDSPSIPLGGLHKALEPGRWLVLSGERTDIPGVTGIQGRELAMLSGLTHGFDPGVPGDVTRTTLLLATKPAYAYRRATVVISANVAPATHGETRTEVLGAGNAARPFQSFALKQPPLTFTPEISAAGVGSTLQVLVDDVAWSEAASLVGLGPRDRRFVTDIADGGQVTVTFGDGVTGARPPTGVENIRAVYRQGIGKAGNVRDGQISLLLSRPGGVRSVINPLAATGGADPDAAETIRGNLPIAVAALDRLVSLADYADFTRSFAGIAKAVAQQLSDGARQTVHVTIAGIDDIPIDVTSALHAALVGALQDLGDPALPLIVMPRERVTLVLAAKLKLLPGHQWEVVVRQVRATLLDRFGFGRRALGQAVRLSEIFAAIQGVAGIAYADIDAFGGVPERVADKGTRRLLTLPEISGRIVAIVAPGTGGQYGAASALPPQAVAAALAGADKGTIRPAQLAIFTPAVPDTIVLNQLQ